MISNPPPTAAEPLKPVAEQNSPIIEEAESTLVSASDPVILQLGAYRTIADAERGWQYLSGRFPLVQAFPKRIIPSETDHLFRLRLAIATKAEADALCANIKRGGQDCFLVRPAGG